jgi:hypothetical protein
LLISSISRQANRSATNGPSAWLQAEVQAGFDTPSIISFMQIRETGSLASIKLMHRHRLRLFGLCRPADSVLPGIICQIRYRFISPSLLPCFERHPHHQKKYQYISKS